MSNPTPHPETARLQAFGLGQLDPEEADRLANHVADCSTCCQILQTVPDDRLVYLLRGQPAPEATATFLPPTADSAIPVELANHPRYRVLRLLATGGMGEVYEAEHLVLQRRVALKVIRRSLLTHAGASERFQRELLATARLTHPNIVAALDAEKVGELHFLALELVEGVSLDRLVRDRGALPLAEACDCVRQAALGLQHAHERGLVHRDIKPQNLMRTPAGVVKILDLGLARFVRENVPVGPETQSQVALGTPDYLAPEQARDARSADIRADIYSLGCTLYFLVAGQPPFPGGSVTEKLVAQLEATPVPLRQLCPHLPPEFEKIVQRMMAKNAAERYQTPAEVAAALVPFTRKQTGPDTPTTRHRWLLVAGMLVVLALAGATAPFLFPTPEQKVEQHHTVAPAVPQPAPKQTVGEKSPSVAVPVGAPGQVRTFSGHRHTVGCLALSPDGKTFLAGSEGELWLWDLAKGEVQKRFQGLKHWVRSVAFSPDGRQAISGGRDGVRFWDVATGKETGERENVTAEVTCVNFSSDRRHFLYATDDTVRLCTLQPRKEVQRFPGRSAAFSADGKKILTGKLLNLILWDAGTGSEVKRFEKPPNHIFCVALSPDGRWAASGGYDQKVRLWDATTGQEVKVCAGHPLGLVQALAFAPDGKRLLSAGGDGNACLWEVPSGKELQRFTQHHSPVSAVIFIPATGQALSGGGDALIRLWNLPR